MTYEDAVTTQPIPHGEEYVEEVQDPEGQYIHEILAQEGADGTKEVTTRAEYVDGRMCIQRSGERNRADACAEHHI